MNKDRYVYESEFIADHSSEASLYGILAEECTELAQAALKRQRALLGENLPHKSAAEIRDNLNEEAGDVSLVLSILYLKQLDFDIDEISRWMNLKRRRWVARLEEECHDQF